MRRRDYAKMAGTRDPRTMGADCDNCPLRDWGPPVFGAGNRGARVAIVGEGPGRNEQERGIPFVGVSGEKLDRLLSAIGLPRSQVFVTNATLCFPPGGDLVNYVRRVKKKLKDDHDEEGFKHPVDCCRERLFRELGIKKCKACDRWEAGPRDSSLCVCRHPDWTVHAGGLEKLEVVVPVGNAAMQSLLGFSGIQAWRGSQIDVDRWRRTGDAVSTSDAPLHYGEMKVGRGKR